MRVKQGTKVQVRTGHPHHANKAGVFAFFSADREAAVVEVEKRGNCKVFIAVKPADLQVYSSHN